ncbi:elongation factor p [Phtheirospermum japonicum]|uniref:Elongation factor p n=1 Tax=Phtheirospermum japonicum TaxID=374723 RepID=A0A830C2R7_9LAMI|nr:elongation factor p [Phtheirospermum japonicum]
MPLILSKRLSAALRSHAATISRNRHNITTCTHRSRLLPSVRASGGLLESPWSATQLRRARFAGADVRPGNVIERRGKIYEVVKADHTTQGRGGAIIQVELRDVDSGSKVNERLRTDEKIEKIFVEEKSLTYLYTDDETGNIVLMEPDTYSQLEVPRHLFGDSLVYLQDDMTVTVQLYDERPLSASIPHRVTCSVAESDEARPGSSKSSPSKRVLLDNGVTLQAPAHIAVGDKIVVNTTNSSYVSRSGLNNIFMNLCPIGSFE